MADAKITRQAVDSAEAANEDQAAVAVAVERPDAPKASTSRDRATAAAHKAELDRQADIAKAVGKAGKDELPKLGGPLMNPGLGR